ncbi:MAG TPA: hypothetical protein VJ729_02860 [Nitrososphaeraceae archaeon]|nr:hypothetical protein [Nitrososphaeraceae archaeon]
MKTYQTLALIACMIGMFLMLGIFITESAFIRKSQVFLNMTKHLTTNNTQNAISQQKYNASKAAIGPFMSGLALSFFIYFAGIVITFVVKNAKAIGITLLVIGVITMVITNGLGIIAFAVLLPTSIVALRHKINPLGTAASAPPDN